ncbi:MAG TPA: LacI family transcriptional regulator, partial [Spirochaetia bacterium]|nr:LacI family transcriptional regulator [Spirochaetia bacterium]
MRGIDDYAVENDFNVVAAVGAPLDPLSPSDKKRVRVFDFIGKDNVDGVIMSRKVSRGLSGAEIHAYLKKYAPLPVVNIGKKARGIPSVSYSIADSIREMVGHLVRDHGFTKILFVRGRDTNYYARERHIAFCDTMQSLNLKAYVLEPGIGDYYYEGGREAIRILIEERRERYQAIIAENNLMALGILDALKSVGIDVPGDIAVTGTYELEAENPFEIPITSVFVPFYDHGRLAAELLGDQIRGKKVKPSVTTPVGLRIGTTCGCFFPEMRGKGDAVPVPQGGPCSAATPPDDFPRQSREQLLAVVETTVRHYQSGKRKILT